MAKKKTMSATEIIKNHGGEDVKGYILVNNFGYIFDHEGRTYDARFWANCYGASLMVWRVSPLRNPEEERAPKQDAWAKELEDELNSDKCNERS